MNAIPNRLEALSHYIQKTLEDHDIDSAEIQARRILKNRANLDWSDIIARPDWGLNDAQMQHIDADLKRCIAGEPLSRIYGVREFWGLEFELSADTLDPRPDTETLIEAVLKAYEGVKAPRNILDLGTGSGCILIALLREFPNARGLGVDKALGSVQMAQKNAETNKVSDRAVFQTGDWGQGIEQKFDLIVSNPPYISNQVIPNLSKTVKNHDPILALDGGNDGLDAYKKIFSQIFSLFNEGGKGFFEIGYDQEVDVVRLAEESRIRVQHVHHDLSGQPRVVEISSGDK